MRVRVPPSAPFFKMPIYEFYCDRCNTIYNFFSRTVNTETMPPCPLCKDIQLKRKVSLFAHVSGKGETDTASDMPQVDEAKMERAMSMLASEAGSIDENDPRQAATLMRKLTDMTGISMGSGMEEALSRIERGEDPAQIEAEMGEILKGEYPFVMENKAKRGTGKTKPKVDETLYEL